MYMNIICERIIKPHFPLMFLVLYNHRRGEHYKNTQKMILWVLLRISGLIEKIIIIFPRFFIIVLFLMFSCQNMLLT